MEPTKLITDRVFRGLSCHFLCLKKQDLDAQKLEQLQELLIRLRSGEKLPLKIQKIYKKLIELSEKRVQDLQKSKNYPKLMNISSSFANSSKMKTSLNEQSKFELSNINFLKQDKILFEKTNKVNQSFTYLNETTLDFQKCLNLQGNIINGALRIKIKVKSKQTKQQQVINFLFDPYQKQGNFITYKNLLKLGIDKQGNFKDKSSINIKFDLQIEGKFHKFCISQHQNVLGSSFAQQRGIILQANFRQHERKFLLTFTQ